jgi:hypothetical protein
LSWPLIGRTGELSTIAAAISAPAVSGILVCGAEGVGKSRIAREGLSASAAQGCDTRWTVGTSPGRAIPLGAFNAWAPSAVADTVQLLRGVIESLTAAAAPATNVVLAVDDVHLLDELSTFVVHQIVQQGAAKVILTVRDDEPIPIAIQEIWKAGQFDRLDIEQLSLSETTTLLSAALDGPVDADAAQRLWKLTRGNVLYLRNIVEQEVADRRIVQEAGYWRWIGDPVMPPGLVGLVESRVGAVPAAVSDVIDVLAVGDHGRGSCRGGRDPWPHHTGARGTRHRSARVASALRPGPPQACAAEPATSAARTGRHRTRRSRGPRRHRSRRAPGDVEPRLRPDT